MKQLSVGLFKVTYVTESELVVMDIMSVALPYYVPVHTASLYPSQASRRVLVLPLRAISGGGHSCLAM